MRFYGGVIFFVVISLCLATNQHVGVHNLEITEDSDDSFHGTYTSDNVTLTLASNVKNDDIISAIYLQQNHDTLSKITELSVPKDNLYKRYITGIEKRIQTSAKDLLRTLKEFGFHFDELIQAFNGMVDELHSKTSKLPFNHIRSSLFYHSSIVYATKRLLQGVPIEAVCPPYDAYEYRGLFMCEQEYKAYYHLAVESTLFECTSKQCVAERLTGIGKADTADQLVSVQGQNSRTKRSFFSLNETLKAFARWIACGSPDCKVKGCEDDKKYGYGWNILGSDWGCCGDYPGCCYYAENTCLIHDAICTCCTFNYFCIDTFCKPDPWCGD